MAAQRGRCRGTRQRGGELRTEDEITRTRQHRLTASINLLDPSSYFVAADRATPVIDAQERETQVFVTVQDSSAFRTFYSGLKQLSQDSPPLLFRRPQVVSAERTQVENAFTRRKTTRHVYSGNLFATFRTDHRGFATSIIR